MRSLSTRFFGQPRLTNAYVPLGDWLIDWGASSGCLPERFAGRGFGWTAQTVLELYRTRGASVKLRSRGAGSVQTEKADFDDRQTCAAIKFDIGGVSATVL